MNQAYKVTVIDSINGMAELAKEWSTLLSGSRSNTIFLTWEWLFTWSECFLLPGRHLFVLLVYHGGELIGVAPWCINHLRYFGCSMKKIEFLGFPETGSDYLDVFAARGKEKEVARQIYHFLQKSSDVWDCIELQGISSESLFLLHFLNELEEQGKSVELGSGPYCPSVSLPQTMDIFMAQISPNRRQQFSRHLRILRRSGEVTHRIHSAGEVGPALKEFYRLYEQRWGEAKQLFRFLEMVNSRAEGKVWIQVDILNTGGRDIGGILHLRYGKTMSLYLMGVDHSFDKSISVGNLLVGLSIERSIVEGFSRYDFLRGDEDYKFHWFNEGKRELRLSCYGKKTAPLMWMTGRFVKSIAKVLLR